MIVQGEPRGALIVQDIDHEHAFRNENLPFLMALANQAGSIIYNARLLEEIRQRAIQLETAAQIARDVSGSLNLDDLLKKADNFIRERFNFYHAGIFLIDLPGEFAVIREATGEFPLRMTPLNFDVSLPIGQIGDFAELCRQRLEQLLGPELVDQGHGALGDLVGQQEAVIHRGDDIHWDKE